MSEVIYFKQYFNEIFKSHFSYFNDSQVVNYSRLMFLDSTLNRLNIL